MDSMPPITFDFKSIGHSSSRTGDNWFLDLGGHRVWAAEKASTTMIAEEVILTPDSPKIARHGSIEY
jgi:hypothetical protein